MIVYNSNEFNNEFSKVSFKMRDRDVQPKL